MNQILNTYRKRLGIPENPDVKVINDHEVFAQQFNIILEENVPILSFTFGLPTREQIMQLKHHHTLLIGTATSVREAKILKESGCDMIVAQGSEAGGHRGSFEDDQYNLPLIGSMALIPQLVDEVNIPVIASGGIMDGRGLVASLALGALAVQMGTAFLTTSESGINKKYKEALLNCHDDYTVITNAFSGKPARGIKNKFIAEMQDYQADILEYPIQHRLTMDIRKEAGKQNITDFMSLWAGQGASLAKEMTVNQLMINIIEEAEQTLRRFA